MSRKPQKFFCAPSFQSPLCAGPIVINCRSKNVERSPFVDKLVSQKEEGEWWSRLHHGASLPWRLDSWTVETMGSAEAMTGGILNVFFEPNIFPDPGVEEERIVREGSRWRALGFLVGGWRYPGKWSDDTWQYKKWQLSWIICRFLEDSWVLGKVANMTNRRFEAQIRWYLAAEKRGRQKRSSQGMKGETLDKK